jgi:uncharacterized membrane protein
LLFFCFAAAPDQPSINTYMKLAGIILIIIGIVALVYQGFSYTQTEKDAQIGPIKIQHDETHTVPIPPIVGGVCIVGGVAALILGARGKI